MSPIQRIELKRLIVFGTVGSCNTLVCYALYAALVRALGWHHNTALVADYAFGAVLGFTTHRLSTFADRKHVKHPFRKYLTTLAVSFLLNLALLNCIVATRLLNPLAGQAVAIGLVTLVSYMLQKHWVFRSHHSPEAAGEIVGVDPIAVDGLAIHPAVVEHRQAA